MKKLVINAVYIGLASLSFAQIEINGGPVNVPSENIVDGVYIKEHIPTKRLVPYEYVREADVIWSKRVWRRIDLREKINHPLYFPKDEILDPEEPIKEWVKHTERWSLWTIIKHHVFTGDLTLFSPYSETDINKETLDGDLFKYPVKPTVSGATYYDKRDATYNQRLESYFSVKGLPRLEKIYSKLDIDGDGALADDSIVQIPDPLNPGMMIDSIAQIEKFDMDWIMSQHIVAYEIKEDWFFDKERSVMDVRILGICPVVYEKVPKQTTAIGGNNNNEGSGSLRQLFWLYFPHCRFVFNNYFAYNTKNDAQWMSFDDLFWKRQFSSYIIKESNVFDRKLESYRTGVDALHESNRITEEIRQIEHDVWHF